MQSTQKSMLYMIYIMSVIAIFLIIRFIYYEKSSAEDVVIKINDYTLTANEFNELFTESGIYEDTPKARSAFMENLVTRKLLLQEGQRKHIDKQREFLKSIENFWEQALLKVVLDRKTREVSNKIALTEQELGDFYAKWLKNNPNNTETLDDIRELIEWQLLRKKQRMAINSWIARLKNNADIEIDKAAVGVE